MSDDLSHSSPHTTAPSHTFSIPNLLTYARILVIPLIVVLLFYADENQQTTNPHLSWARWAAFALYVFAGITDFLDGYLARALSLHSPLGRMLDPIADKILIATCLFMLVANHTLVGISIIPALIILCREITVSGLREFLSELSVRMPVSQLAKWKTAAQIVAVGFLIAGSAGETLLPHTELVGKVLLWIAALLTLYTGWDYLKAGLRRVLT
jgi:cardiolipin synthase (CMP-forming)